MNDTTNSVTDALSYLAASKSAILSGEPWTPTMQEMYLAAADSLDTLRAQLAEAQKDSERLDWIDKQTYEGANPRGNVWMIGWKGHSISGIDFRAAIDIAKREQ